MIAYLLLLQPNKIFVYNFTILLLFVILLCIVCCEDLFWLLNSIISLRK